MKPLPSIWKNGFEKHVSVCLGFVLMILTWGLRIPKVTCQRHGYPGILWGSIPIPRKTGHQGISSGSTIGASFPLIRWDDDDKRETVSNTKVSKWQTFSNKTLELSSQLLHQALQHVSKLWVTQKDGYGVWFVGLFCTAATALWWSQDGTKETRFS